MARRFAALKPQLNRIRAWAHEGSTDAWIAHQLETTAESVRAFRQEHGIERGGPAPLAPITPDSVVEAMLAEEAAALEAAADGGPRPGRPSRRRLRPPRRHQRPSPRPKRAAPRRRTRKRAAAASADESKPAGGERRGARQVRRRPPPAAAAPAKQEPPRHAQRLEPEQSSRPPRHEVEPTGRSRRGRARRPAERGAGPQAARKRGGRRVAAAAASRGLEARLLAGSVLLLDPSVASDPTFQEHWGDAGALRVEISTDAIVLRRIAADPEPERSDR